MEQETNQTIDKKKKIAIIGDGLASAICINEIAQMPGFNKLQIDVYTREECIGRGAAYSRKTPLSMRLNHMVKSMRFSDTDGKDFLQYLRTHFNRHATLQDYVPRKIFGDFVEESIRTHFNRYANMNKYAVPVRKILPMEQSIRLITKTEQADYDEVVLCIGNGQERGRLATDNGNLDLDFSGKKISILGASLSALDLVCHLFRNDGPKSPEHISLIQRNAGFRMVRPNTTRQYKLKIFTQAHVDKKLMFTADELLNLLQEEIEAQGVQYDLLTFGTLSQSNNFAQDLRNCIKRLADDPLNLGDHPEFAVYGIINAIIVPLMTVFEQEKISPAEADMFRRIAEKSVVSFLAPMPPVTAIKVIELIDTGRLDIINGIDGETIDLTNLAFDRCIDARGNNSIVRNVKDLPKLVADIAGEKSPGLISALGGIAYDAQTSRMKSRSGKISPRMPYIVGQLKKGQQFDNSESLVIYNDIKHIVRDIALHHL